MFDIFYMIVWVRLFSFAAFFARRSNLDGITMFLTRTFARMSLMIRKAKRQSSLEKMALEWQRMFPSRKINPITSIEEDTVYAEVKVNCPLRGSGDLWACHHLMEYDREMLRKIGGQLVVLRSQAEPGVTVCQVALRLAGHSTEDLIPAT